MNYRKDCGSPRDMVDTAILGKLLEENNESCGCGYGDGINCGANRRVKYHSRAHMQNPCNCSQSSQSAPMPDNKPENGTCESCRVTDILSSYPLAMVYAPDQEWKGLYEPDCAMKKGTMFSELDFPFYCGC